MDHLIGLVVVICIFGGGIIRSILQSWERRMELQAQRQQGQNDAVTQQLAALRAEVAALRDTSTQFDLALENTVQRLEDRVNRIETKVQPSLTSSVETPVQRIGHP